MPKVVMKIKEPIRAKRPPLLPPVTPRYEPGWDLSGIGTDYLVAELVRRGYRVHLEETEKVKGATNVKGKR